ncbi:PQQ-dependent sugar dehydrogenase [Acetobacter farinalis]|uniref:PQQ-dependent sugar dehydrogenase n=1 Tax=Acetobacter farinalis TaxID=1260984 RepID=A0ABT3Q6J4_9PROT|nr:PQQ-dependent sugar dehydrogenase [Acetobacter farinalis]MCX2560901.1 PQQ-dependent sugar dehydrogenase [Acetobacter farinalis]NHO29550.1 sorbosone dehydrogenase family protein [Acetobacter farinalis]
MCSCAVALSLLAGASGGGSALAAPEPDQLRVLAGFHIAVFSDQVPGAREIALGAQGTVFVGTMGQGVVYAVSTDKAGRATKVRTLARGLDMPVGVAFHQGALYVSEPRRIVVLRDIEHHLDAPPAPQTVADSLPYRGGDHSWKFIAFGPDGRLYVPIGAPCNICDVGHDFGRLLSMRSDGTDRQDVAFGIRNTVGFTWQPGTGALWFTDNGRDNLGDTLPSDELNRVSHPGESFGYPYCHQGTLPDPEFGMQRSCREFTPPALLLGAHVAALGLRFYGGSQFPKALQGALMIAEHGSWNSSALVGYQVVAVRFGADGKPQTPEVLVSGFRQGQRVWGRPVDVQPMADGSVLISDDLSGALYRLTYGKAR